jgi:hypothetical protein
MEHFSAGVKHAANGIVNAGTHDGIARVGRRRSSQRLRRRARERRERTRKKEEKSFTKGNPSTRLRAGEGNPSTVRRFGKLTAGTLTAGKAQGKRRGPPAAGGGEEASGRRKCGRMGVWACGRGVRKRLEAVEPLELLNR